MKRQIAWLALVSLTVSVALLSVVGCSKKELDAEIVIVVDSDFAVPGQLNAVGFYVNRVGGDPANQQDIVVPLTGEFGKTLPLRLGIAPEGDVKTAVEVIVEGYHYKDLKDLKADVPPPVVRRKARLRFQRGKVLLLRMDLVLACKDTFLTCEAQKGAGTCDEHGCANIEEPEIHPWSGSDDSHSPWDAGAPELDGAQSMPENEDGGTPPDGSAPVDPSDGGGEPDVPEVAEELALGEFHSCVRTSRGRVFCWGSDQHNQLGDSAATHGQTCTIIDGPEVDCSPMPVLVGSLPAASQLSANVYTTCAVHKPRELTKANVSCWGELPQGLEGATAESISFKSLLLDDVTEVRVGGRHSCVLREGHLPVCWGEYSTGELGNGDAMNYPEDDITEANKLKGLVEPDDIKSLAVGDRHSCVLLKTGSVWCWGGNEQGQSGVPLTTDVVLIPTEAEGASGTDTLFSGGAHMCGLVENEGAYCWGYGLFGQLGIGDPDVLNMCPGPSWCTPSPVKVIEEDLGSTIVQLALGYEFSCARLEDGRVACWGRNQHHQVGVKVPEGREDVEVPVETLDQKTLQLAAGDGHACAILEDHSVVCWGRNDTAQLGVAPDGSSGSAKPVKVQLPF